jgi:UrcA family protein
MKTHMPLLTKRRGSMNPNAAQPVNSNGAPRLGNALQQLSFGARACHSSSPKSDLVNGSTNSWLIAEGEMNMNAMTTFKRFRILTATVLFGGLACGFAVLPAEADSSDVPQFTVKFSDLNISSPRGAAVLYGRIRAAAEKVCSPYDRSGLEFKVHLNACIDEAILGAVNRVNNSALTAVYSAKTGKEVSTRLVSVAK